MAARCCFTAGRPACFAELFGVGRGGNGFDVREPQLALVAPVEESFYPRVYAIRGIAVADGRSKKFDETAAGAFALGRDRRW